MIRRTRINAHQSLVTSKKQKVCVLSCPVPDSAWASSCVSSGLLVCLGHCPFSRPELCSRVKLPWSKKRGELEFWRRQKAAGAAATEAGVPARAPLEPLRADQDLSMSLSLSQNSSAKGLHQHSCRLRKNEDSLLRGI